MYYKEDKTNEVMYNSYSDKPETTVRPIRRLYINFDKDIAHKMFGYRIRFMEDYMKLYSQIGIPSVYADQSHKPVHYYAEEMSQICNEKYKRIQNYQTRQVVVKILDSDNEEENAEILKNKKMIRTNSRVGVNYGNNNPKIKKK